LSGASKTNSGFLLSVALSLGAEREKRMVHRIRCARRPSWVGSLVLILFCSVADWAAQQGRDASTSQIDWQALIPQIQSSLGAAFTSCNVDNRVTQIIRTADITGDTVPEALVEYCRGGAYTSEVAIMRLERAKPVVVRFRDSNRKPIKPVFANGASVRNGEGTGLLPEKHAVYTIHWHTDDFARLETCSVEAYVWTPRSATFDLNKSVAREIADRECARLRKQLPTH